MGDLTLLLQQSSEDSSAARAVFDRVYSELRQIAAHHMAGERAAHTLQTTALVHEAYLRLVGLENVAWANRAHFFKAAAEAMRRILIDYARARGAAKRGGDRSGSRVSFDVVELALDDDSSRFMALDACISRLNDRRPEIGAVVQLRFFAGLNTDDTAAALGVSPRTVDRHWAFARAWLRRELEKVET
jgi:RNA polymerase sigma factor (TIGR02999 family)